MPDVLDINRNPRLWPIRYRLLCDLLVIKTKNDPLTFRWSGGDDGGGGGTSSSGEEGSQ